MDGAAPKEASLTIIGLCGVDGTPLYVAARCGDMEDGGSGGGGRWCCFCCEGDNGTGDDGPPLVCG